MKELECKTFYQELKEWSITSPFDLFLKDNEVSLTCKDTISSINFLVKELKLFGIDTKSEVVLKSVRSVRTVLLILSLNAIGCLSHLVDDHEDITSFSKEEDIKSTLFIDYKNNEYFLNGKKIEFGFLEEDIVETKNVYDETMVLYTSGSTGRRKGVVISQASIIYADKQTQPIGDYRKDDVSGVILPLYHVFGLCMVIASLLTHHIAYFPSFKNYEILVKELKENNVTRLNGVPSVYLSLNLELKKENTSLPSLRVGLLGGSPSSKELFKHLENDLDMKLLIVYGMTECSGICCCSIDDSFEKRCSTVGKPYPYVEVIIKKVNEKDDFGEICIKCKGMLNRYYHNEPCFDANGYFHTGDLGSFDDGFLSIKGRIKDIIIRNGNKLVSKFIEDAFVSVDGVLEASVIPFKDESEGEVPYLFISLSREDEINSIIDLGKSKLKKNEIPKFIKVLDVLPKTSSGKIDKIALRNLV